jgi:Spy/CpxP family protein refolding chaperone
MRKQFLFLLGILATTGLAVAQQRPPAREPRSGRGLDPSTLKQELGLRDQQVSQLRKLQLDNRKAAIRRHADTQLARLALRELMDSSTVDEKVLQARIKELSELHAAQLRARADAQLAVRKILDTDQREKLAQLRAQRPRPRFDGDQDQGPGRGPRGPRPRPRRGDDGEQALTGPDVR